MFSDEIQAGEKLVLSLSQIAELSSVTSQHPSTALVRFTHMLDAWRAGVERRLMETLGDDPRSRFSYLFQLFHDELYAAGHTIGARDVESLRGVVKLLKHFQQRFDPAIRSQDFDWRQPITAESPTPDLAQIESKRWEFHEALLREGEANPTQEMDPLEVARNVGLHESHAREFFIYLARIGRLRRDRLSAMWRQLANEVDTEDSMGVPSAPSTPRKPLTVFLCHASEDKEPVRELARYVRGLGHEAWLDEDRLLPGQDFDYEIRQALRRCDVVLVCLSDNSMKRGYIQRELKRALDVAEEFPAGELFLIPLRLASCEIPDHLKHLHYVDLFQPNGLKRLSAALALRASA
jgi:hypothetical protein